MADTGVRPTFALEAFGDLEGGGRRESKRTPHAPR